MPPLDLPIVLGTLVAVAIVAALARAVVADALAARRRRRELDAELDLLTREHRRAWRHYRRALADQPIDRIDPDAAGARALGQAPPPHDPRR
jgi:type II secretory pathway pseudopilin PulG